MFYFLDLLFFATNINVPKNLSATGVRDFLFKNDSLDWEFLNRIREMWPNKLIVKGIMHPNAAAKCLEAGADAIVVSNHGGIASDAALASIDVLPEIADGIGGRASVLVDGGFKRGSDILKGLALGAKAVMLARPIMWGLAAYGADGVERALYLLINELARNMAASGRPKIDMIDRALVRIDSR